MAMKLDNMQALLIEELNDLYSTEEQIIDVLPQMISAVTSPQLKDSFQQHLQQTQKQKDRLDRVFREFGASPEHKKCKGMEGILKEGKDIAKAKGNPQVRDAALISAAQRVEHYEMAGYGSARTFAQVVGRTDVADLLQQTLNEEGETDKRLTQVAVDQLNEQAARASQGKESWQAEGRSRQSTRSRSASPSPTRRSTGRPRRRNR